MKILGRSATALLFTFGLATSTVSSLHAAVGAGWFQEYPPRYMDMRGIVDRTQSDLRQAAELEHGNSKQRDRYRDAQEHLSNFDRSLTRGRFDNGQLDKAIGNIQGILKNNVLQASSRDMLMRDENELRQARGRRW